MKKKQEVKAVEYLWLALYAFAGLGLEVVLLYGEVYVYNIQPADWGIGYSVRHWGLTCLIWGSMMYWLVRNAKKNLGYQVLALKAKPAKKQLVVTSLAAIIGLVIMNASWDGLKVVIEYQKNGFLRFVFQYIYYMFEVGLVTLIIVFGQEFGERVTKGKKMIWGGMILALTWGVVHILTQDLVTGMLTVILSLLFGIIHLSVRKNLFLTYLFVAIIFVL